MKTPLQAGRTSGGRSGLIEEIMPTGLRPGAMCLTILNAFTIPEKDVNWMKN